MQGTAGAMTSYKRDHGSLKDLKKVGLESGE